MRHDPNLVRLPENPGEGDVDPGCRNAGEVAGRILGEGPIGVVDLHLRDRDRLGAAGTDEEVNATIVENAALERQPSRPAERRC